MRRAGPAPDRDGTRPSLPAGQHAGTEADLAASGIAFTALRHGFYAESCLRMIGDGLRSGELRLPEDGPVSWTVRPDLAEADAAILASEGAWNGITPPLTAADAITIAQLATMASEATGREVRHTTVTDEEWRDAKIAGAMPALYADMLLGTFRAARRVVSPRPTRRSGPCSDGRPGRCMRCCRRRCKTA